MSGKLIFVLVSLVFLFGLSFAQTNVSGCQVIAASGHYELNESISGANISVSGVASITQACIVINSSNVLFSCNGYNITNDGTADAAGILVNGSAATNHTNVTIQDCPEVSAYERGIYLHRTSQDIITNTTATENEYAYSVYYSDENNFTDNLAHNNTNYGFWLTNSNSNNLSENFAYNNSRSGFRLDAATYNVLVDNEAYDNYWYGFSFWSASDSNTLMENEAYRNNRSGFALGADHNALSDNQAYNNSYSFTAYYGSGFYISGAYNNLTNNSALNNTHTGFYLGAITAHNNTLVENVGAGNGYYGLHLRGASTATAPRENRFFNNTFYNNTGNGIYLYWSFYNNFTNNSAYENGGSGFYLRRATYNTFITNFAFENIDEGFHGYDGGTSNTFLTNLAENNSATGFRMRAGTTSSNDNILINNTARNNSGDGFQFYYHAHDTLCVNNTAVNNSGNGIELYQSDYCLFDNNTLLNNAGDGIYASYHSYNNNITNNRIEGNNNGIGLANLMWGGPNLVENNTVCNNSGTGMYLGGVVTQFVNFTNNLVCNNGGDGIYLSSNGYNHFIDNQVYNNTNGIRFYNSNYNVLWNNSIHDNRNSGMYLAHARYSNLSNNTIANNSGNGIYLESCYQLSFNRTTLYNNEYDFYTDADGVASEHNLTETLFLNPSGTLFNYTNLTIIDVCATTDEYSINWSSATVPGDSVSFDYKFVDITVHAGTPSIDQVLWQWTNAEVIAGGYNENLFSLVRYTAGAWQLVNSSADTINHQFDQAPLTPPSGSNIYGILQYISNISVLKLNQTILQPSPGGIVEFNITINNTGNITLDTVLVRDQLPSGLTFSSAYPAQSSVAGGIVTWNNVGPISDGASAVIYLNATVDAGVVYPTNEIVNLTNYINATGSSNLSSNVFGESYANATIYYANVTGVKADVTVLPPSPGGQVDFQITITNTGNVTLSPISVVDTLPAGFTYDSTNTLPVSVAGQVVNWTISLNPGTNQIITMRANVSSAIVPGTYTNQLSVEGVPPNGDNVTDTDSVAVGINSSAINVVKTASDYTPTVGDQITYTLNITNTGEVNLSFYALDTLPPGMTFVEAVPANTSSSGQVIYWDNVYLNVTPGDFRIIEYNVTVDSTGAKINEVNVTGVPLNGDNVTSNDSVTLNSNNPPSPGSSDDGPDEDKEMQISVSLPRIVGEELTFTVTSEGSPVANAAVEVCPPAPATCDNIGYSSGLGLIGYTPEVGGEHTVHAERSGYEDAEDEFNVESVECTIDSECVASLNNCFVCGADNECTLATGYECGFDSDCIGYTGSKEVLRRGGDEIYTDVRKDEGSEKKIISDEFPTEEKLYDELFEPLFACINCMCEEVECLTDQDCPEGETCIDYECTPTGEPTEPEPGNPCTSNSDCVATQECSSGTCVDVPCFCGEVIEHECNFFECCNNMTCVRLYNENYFCNLDVHECEEEAVEPPISGDEPIDVDMPPETEVGDEVSISVTSGGTPVGGAAVSIYLNGEEYGSAITDANGNADFVANEEGEYTVVVTKPGFATGEDRVAATAEAPASAWESIISGVWLLLFVLIVIGILYVLFTKRKKKRR